MQQSKQFPLTAALVALMLIISGVWSYTIATSTQLNDLYVKATNDSDILIERWIEQLSSQTCCEGWEQAEWTSIPLGPGTRSKLITLQLDNQPLGYFVLTASQTDEWVLSEYGVGSYPLFSEEVLYSSISQHPELQKSINETSNSATLTPSNNTVSALLEANFEIERLYFNGLEALWSLKCRETESHYFADAKSGEIYPMEAETIKLLSQINNKQTALGLTLEQWPAMIQISHYSSFDPYDHVYWLLADPVSIDLPADLQSYLRQSRVTYLASLFDQFLTDPYPIIALEDDERKETYIGIDKAGKKYVPFSLLLAHGNFYVPGNN